jgi:hypothetical protein
VQVLCKSGLSRENSRVNEIQVNSYLYEDVP